MLGELVGVDAPLGSCRRGSGASGAISVEESGYVGVVFGCFDESWDAGGEQRIVEYFNQVFDQLPDLFADGCGVNLGAGFLVAEFEAVAR